MDESRQAVQLMGMSSHGLHWFPNCYTKASIQHITESWGTNVFRAAMYVGEEGYSQQPGLKDTVKNIVQWCKELGIYVIIDWHVLTPGDPNAATYNGASPFFEDMAHFVKDEKHVLFEICNEPNGVSWSTVKSYADNVISAIRAIDEHIVIIIGTPTWSRDIHEARRDPVSNPHNVMYAFHFYAGSHMGLLERVRSEAALIPIFVTEWGASTYSGDGGVFSEQAKTFLDLFRDASGQKISWAQWSFADKHGSSAALLPGSCSSQDFDVTSCSGTLLKNYIRVYAETCPSGPTPPPTTLPPTLPPTLWTSAPTVPTPPPTPVSSGSGQCYVAESFYMIFRDRKTLFSQRFLHGFGYVLHNCFYQHLVRCRWQVRKFCVFRHFITHYPSAYGKVPHVVAEKGFHRWGFLRLSAGSCGNGFGHQQKTKTNR